MRSAPGPGSSPPVASIGQCRIRSLPAARTRRAASRAVGEIGKHGDRQRARKVEKGLQLAEIVPGIVDDDREHSLPFPGGDAREGRSALPRRQGRS